MSSEQTDVGHLTEKFGAIFYDQGFGDDAPVSLPENKDCLKPTNCHQENIPKYGDCYIFDYQKFKAGERLTRPGSEKDVKRLKHDFSELNFNVYDFLNLTKQKTENELKKAAKNVSKQSECFVCCFLTHGSEGNLSMKDTYIKIDDILKYFSRSACKSLAGKPKIFIFQACRGNCCEEGVSCDSTDGGDIIEFPDDLDFLLVYSTYEGKYSFKTKDKEVKKNNHGSYFIDELCRTLEQFSDQLDLLQILTIVNYRVAHFFLSKTKDEATDKKKQMPCFTSRLRTEVKFNVKIPIFASDDTIYFDRKRSLSSLGKKSTERPLEDKQTYKIQNSKAINFHLLLNKENKFGTQLTGWATRLWTNIAIRDYKREELKDWTKDGLMNYLKIVSARDFSNTDCFICFVVCQAKGDDLYDKEGKDFHVREIVEEFTGKVCPGLRGKPKIFIFLMSPSSEKTSSTESTDGDDFYNKIPVHSDLLEVAITIQEPHQLVGVMERFCNIFGRKNPENLLSQLTKMNDELVKDYGFYSLLDKNSATFCLKSTLTETLVLNKPKCKS